MIWQVDHLYVIIKKDIKDVFHNILVESYVQ